MRATGIGRRIDDLGRSVVPKEIRRTLRICEGNLLLTTLLDFVDTYGKREKEGYRETVCRSCTVTPEKNGIIAFGKTSRNSSVHSIVKQRGRF